MMDLKDFSQPSFNPKEWINKTVQSTGKDDCTESITTLAMKLQGYFRQLNNDFESTALKVIQNLPRVMQETEMLADEAKTLREKMKCIKQDIAKVGRDTDSSIISLEKMDRLKLNLESAKEALHEENRWIDLTLGVKRVLELKDVDDLVNSLKSMQMSLDKLSPTADHSMKKDQLEVLKNELEVLVSPAMVEAFTSRTVEQSKRFFYIFQSINRPLQFVSCYTRCQKKVLIQNWKEIIKSDSRNNVLESLQNYYGMLVVSWEDQFKWWQSVASDIAINAILIQLYTDLFNDLREDIYDQVLNSVKDMAEPLVLMLQLKSSAQQLISNMRPYMYGVEEQRLVEFAKAVYSPFVFYIENYGAYQKAFFSKFLTENQFAKGDRTNFDAVQDFSHFNLKVFSIINDSHTLCQQLTHGCTYFGFIDALKVLLCGFLKQVQVISQDLTPSAEKYGSTNIFQICLTILEGLGDLLQRIKQLDDECVSVLSELYCNISDNTAHPSQKYSKLFLTPDKEQGLLLAISKVLGMEEPTVLDEVTAEVHNVCHEVYQTSYKVIFNPILGHLNALQDTSTWKASHFSFDLPDYSVTPQEYITKIGQYLLNLPQLLEPFMVEENPLLTLALTSVLRSAFSTQLLEDCAEEIGFAKIVLSQITKETCEAYCNIILSMKEIPLFTCKQLIIDIGYLGNVFNDLSFVLTDQLKEIDLLLQLSPSEYSSKCVGCNPKLVAKIRQVRGLKAISN